MLQRIKYASRIKGITIYGNRKKIIRCSLILASSILILVILISLLVSSYVWPKMDYAHVRSLHPAIYDSSGKYCGIIAGAIDPHADFSTSRSWGIDHKTFEASPEIPEVWESVLRILEDRNLGNFPGFMGLDPVGLIRAVVSGGKFGGSTLGMMIIRTLLIDDSSFVFPEYRYNRKLKEILYTPAMYLRLGEDGIIRWASLHLAVARGARGSDFGAVLHGISPASLAVFNKTPNELSAAEQALLAAAVKHHFLLKPLRKDSYSVDETQFLKTRRRAVYGISQIDMDETEKNAAINELQGMSAPTVRIDPEWLRILPSDESETFKAYANPQRLSIYAVKGESNSVIAELLERFGWSFREEIATVTISIDAVANRTFKEKFEERLSHLEKCYKDKINIPLIYEDSKYNTAEIVFAMADENGRIIRFYSNTAGAYFGKNSLRNSDGKYQHRIGGRTLGSISKAYCAVILGDENCSPDDMFINKCIPGVRNPGGIPGVKSSSERDAYYPAEITFARSLNLPLLNRMIRADRNKIIQAKKDFGITLWDGTPLATAFVLGHCSATPQRVHTFISDLLAYIDDGGLPDRETHIVESVRKYRSSERIIMSDSFRPRIKSWLDDYRSRDFVESVLSSVVHLGGTGQRMSDLIPENDPRIELAIGKTGTGTTEDHNEITDLLMTGGIVLRNSNYKRLTYFVAIRSPMPTRPLGKNISAGEFLAPLIRLAINDVL
ncbi:MAG: transglycosylase domain-containing protein [Candidatus Krumholzibacteriota bacterium]|nr:transglycosylase domain-containing protein [Candidatus Krumholzibacteriota bacterium]